MNLTIARFLALTFALQAGSLCAQTTSVDSEAELLRTLDAIGSTSIKKGALGYEDTPLAPGKAPRQQKKAKGETEITALEGTFDQKTREAVFIGDVVVVDPEFNVKCDRLTAYLKSEKQAPAKAAAASPAAARPDADAEPKSGGLERAVAEANPGNLVLIVQDKLEADGSITKNIGRARKAHYNAVTGDIILTGSPSVQQGISVCVAQEEGTVMTLNRDGRMRVEGKHKTVIKEGGVAEARR
jgi:lipopolysaccharide export system protein LptA